MKALRALPREGRARRAAGRAAGARARAAGRRDRGAGDRDAQRLGGPEVLAHESWRVPAPAPARCASARRAIGVNFIDIYCAPGIYPLVDAPGAAGRRGGGRGEAVGEGVHELLPGDRVAYAALPAGAYAAARTIAGRPVVRLPDDLADETAAVPDAEGHDRGIPAAPHAPPARRRDASSCTPPRAAPGSSSASGRGRWARACWARSPARTRRASRATTAARCRSSPRLPVRRRRARGHRRPRRRRGLRRPGRARRRGEPARARAARPLGELRPGERLDRVDAAERLSSKSVTLSRPVLFHFTAERPALAEMAGRVFDARRAACCASPPPPLRARRRRGSAPRSGSPPNHGPDRCSCPSRPACRPPYREPVGEPGPGPARRACS